MDQRVCQGLPHAGRHGPTLRVTPPFRASRLELGCTMVTRACWPALAVPGAVRNLLDTALPLPGLRNCYARRRPFNLAPHPHPSLVLQLGQPPSITWASSWPASTRALPARRHNVIHVRSRPHPRLCRSTPGRASHMASLFGTPWMQSPTVFVSGTHCLPSAARPRRYARMTSYSRDCCSQAAHELTTRRL